MAPPLLLPADMSETNRQNRILNGAEKLYEMQAEICRVLGHARRIQILDLLADGEKSAAQLLAVLGVSKVNLSQHLALMKHAGLVESRQQGRHVFYRLAFVEIKGACQIIREVLAARLKQGTLLAKDLRSAGRERLQDEESRRR